MLNFGELFNFAISQPWYVIATELGVVFLVMCAFGSLVPRRN